MVKIKQILPQNSKFLQKLDFIALKPKILYYYGELPGGVYDEDVSDRGGLNDDGLGVECSGEKCSPPVVAIVGARKMTPYGEEHAYRAAYELARAGVVIVSGLAYGIDMTAHRGALDAGGRTVAFLGTPIDQVYPANNRGLAEEIVAKGGAVISECPPLGREGYGVGGGLRSGEGGFRGGAVFNELVDAEGVSVSEEELAAWRTVMWSGLGMRAAFLKRNRLISGVADAVIVAEADLRSGSLNTASHAFDQGRLVFAVPGDLSRRMSRGCNGLLGKGAMPYTCPEDVLDELGVKRRTVKRVRFKGDTPAERAVLAAMRAGVSLGDEMLEWICGKGWKLDSSLFNQTITLLEIKGVVRRLYGNQWALRE